MAEKSNFVLIFTFRIQLNRLQDLIHPLEEGKEVSFQMEQMVPLMVTFHRKQKIAICLGRPEIAVWLIKIKLRLSMVIIISPLLVYLCRQTVALSIQHHLTIKIQIENLQIIWIPAIIEGN